MKKLILKILKVIVYIVSKVYSYRLSCNIKSKITLLYSLWISNEIKKMGQGATIEANCFLKGGQFIEIGENSYIGNNGVLTCWDKHLDK